MKITLTPKQRQALIEAGFPRQTVRLWVNGTTPRKGNLILIKQITGIDFDKRKYKAKSISK